MLQQYKPEDRLAGLNIKERLVWLNEQAITLAFRQEEAALMLLRFLKLRFRGISDWVREKWPMPTRLFWKRSLNFDTDADIAETIRKMVPQAGLS